MSAVGHQRALHRQLYDYANMQGNDSLHIISRVLLRIFNVHDVSGVPFILQLISFPYTDTVSYQNKSLNFALSVCLSAHQSACIDPTTTRPTSVKLTLESFAKISRHVPVSVTIVQE
jgi:hypothetical protein